MNKRDTEQLEYWKNIYCFMSASFQIEDDLLQIDKNRDGAKEERAKREKWLLDNWQLIRPSRSTQNRRNPVNIFNIKLHS